MLTYAYSLSIGLKSLENDIILSYPVPADFYRKPEALRRAYHVNGYQDNFDKVYIVSSASQFIPDNRQRGERFKLPAA